MKTALKDLVQVDLQKCVELFLFSSSLLFENKLHLPSLCWLHREFQMDNFIQTWSRLWQLYQTRPVLLPMIKDYEPGLMVLCNPTLHMTLTLTVHAVILSCLSAARLGWGLCCHDAPLGPRPHREAALSRPAVTLTGQQPHLHCVATGGCPATTQ